MALRDHSPEAPGNRRFLRFGVSLLACVTRHSGTPPSPPSSSPLWHCCPV